MSEAQARRLAAMLTDRQRRDMLLLAAVLQAENSQQQEKNSRKISTISLAGDGRAKRAFTEERGGHDYRGQEWQNGKRPS